MSNNQRMKQERRQLEREGFTATYTGGGHIKFTHPQMDGPVFTAATPSDHRAILNVRALIRRKMRGAPETVEIAAPLRPDPPRPPPAAATPPQPARSPEPPIVERLVLEAFDAAEHSAALDRNSEQQVARRVALGLGLVRYHGQPCPRGHAGERYASSGGCVVCAEESARRQREKRAAWKLPAAGTKPTPQARPRPEPVVWWRPGWIAIDGS